MTTTTWTAETTTTTPTTSGVDIIALLKKAGHFIAICAGAHAEADSKFRGLDLNGNPMWAK